MISREQNSLIYLGSFDWSNNGRELQKKKEKLHLTKENEILQHEHTFE